MRPSKRSNPRYERDFSGGVQEDLRSLGYGGEREKIPSVVII